MVSQDRGRAVAFALNKLQDRAEMFVAPGDEVYEGMIVGENSRDNDLVVNPIKEKKLTNMRASGSDENVILKPPRRLSLEMSLEYIEDDEYVEVTPKAIRLRKIRLTEQERKQNDLISCCANRVFGGTFSFLLIKCVSLPRRSADATKKFLQRIQMYRMDKIKARKCS